MNKHISKKAKAAVAACLGVSLLLGGSTYALWTTNASVASKATVTSGDLKATLLPSQQWQDVSDSANPYTVGSLADYRLAPGSSLKLSQGVNVVAVGDNLKATIHATLPNTTASQALQAQAKFTLTVFNKAGVKVGSIEPTVNTADSLQVDVGAIPHTSTLGDDYRIELTVSLPSSADNATKLQVGSLSDLAVSVTQDDGPPANAASDFTWTTANSQATITGYTGTSKDVVIPKTYKSGGVTYPVTTIGTKAFQSKGLTSVVIPEGLTTIGQYAFSTNSIAKLDIPTTVTQLQNYAFERNSLTKVTIPANVTLVGANAFAFNSITSTVLNNPTATYGSFVFAYNEVTSVVLPEGMTTVASNMYYVNHVSSVKLPSTVTYIGAYAFYRGGGNPMDVTIPSKVNYIGTNAFNYTANAYFEGLTPPTDSTSAFGTGSTATKVYAHSGGTWGGVWGGYRVTIY